MCIRGGGKSPAAQRCARRRSGAKESRIPDPSTESGQAKTTATATTTTTTTTSTTTTTTNTTNNNANDSCNTYEQTRSVLIVSTRNILDRGPQLPELKVTVKVLDLSIESTPRTESHSESTDRGLCSPQKAL